MGKSRIGKVAVWAMVVAYMTLLAHAFVPHHHHGGGTAFLNNIACPHDHSAQPVHGHDHENDRLPAAPNHVGDCETLKHTWLKTVTQDDYRFEQFALFSWAFLPMIECPLARNFTIGKKIRVPWLIGLSSSMCHVAIGLRAPPTLLG